MNELPISAVWTRFVDIPANKKKQDQQTEGNSSVGMLDKASTVRRSIVNREKSSSFSLVQEAHICIRDENKQPSFPDY